MKNKILIFTIAAALPASFTLAQDPGGPRPPGPPPKDGGRRPDGPRPPDPLVHALDTDNDGIISADEIKNASDSLKKLDKNNDGQLTRDEYAPPPPPPPQGDGQRKGGPRDSSKASGAAAKTTDKKPDDWPFGKDKATPASDTKAGTDKPAGDPPAKGQRPPPPPSPLLQALDTDGDGIISADEIGKAPESLAKLDKNNDGQLGPREYMPPPPEGKPPGDGGKDGGKAGAKPAQ